MKKAKATITPVTLNTGDFASYEVFLKVKDVNETQVVCIDTNGEEIHFETKNLPSALKSASNFTKTVELNQTDLIAEFRNCSRTAMTVCWNTKTDPKKAATKIKALYPNKGTIKSREEFCKDVDSIIEDTLIGDIRCLTGYHSNKESVNNTGRIYFYDSEGNTKQVDPRTIQYFVANDTKYVRSYK